MAFASCFASLHRLGTVGRKCYSRLSIGQNATRFMLCALGLKGLDEQNRLQRQNIKRTCSRVPFRCTILQDLRDGRVKTGDRMRADRQRAGRKIWPTLAFIKHREREGSAFFPPLSTIIKIIRASTMGSK